MTDKKTIWEMVSVDKATVEEDEENLTFKDVVLVREGVQQYSDGRAHKSAEELEKYAPFANGWAVAGGHPPEKILTRVDDIAGETKNSRFVKDLHDPKTGRDNIRGVRADLVVWKNKVDPIFLEELRSGKKNDVSVGFLFESDNIPGTWNGQDYDYTQINMFPNHLAYGIERGRCPTPYCGLAADEVTVADENGMITFNMTIHKDYMEGMKAFVDAFPQVANDPLGEFENWDACIKHYTDAGKSQEEAEKICGAIEAEGDKMDNAEIDKKIKELKTQKEELRDKIDEYYRAQDPPEEEDSEITKMYEKLDEINTQIEAYIEAKVIKEVISDDDPPGGQPPVEPELCDCMETWAEKYPEAFKSLPEGHTVIVPETPGPPAEPVLSPAEVIAKAKELLKDPELYDK